MEKRKCSCTVGGNVNWHSHYGRWYWDSLKTRNKTTIWPSNPTPRHIPWGTQNWKNTCIPMFIATLFIIARTWKQLRCPSIDEWIKKLWYIYTVEYNSAIKKECIWVSSNKVDEPRTYYTEWSKSERERYILYTNTYIWNLEK